MGTNIHTMNVCHGQDTAICERTDKKNKNALSVEVYRSEMIKFLDIQKLLKVNYETIFSK